MSLAMVSAEIVKTGSMHAKTVRIAAAKALLLRGVPSRRGKIESS
jgi:hypothetical protein